MAIAAEKSEDQKLAKLQELFTEAEAQDKELFAEQRSNILLNAGEHYTNRVQMGMNNIRIRQDIAPETKIRLTKNHIQKICKLYVNTLISDSPSTRYMPANPKELKDKKSAELREKLWKYAKKKHKFSAKVRSYAKDFIIVGEVGVKIFFDPNKGELVSQEAEIGADGQETGKTISKFSGEFVFEKLYGFNTLRHPQAKTFEESPVIIVRKMVPLRDLKKLAKGDEKKIQAITEDANEEFVIFDAQKGKYSKSKGHGMLREYYFRPCPEYPKGWYVYSVKGAVLDEGELPLGVWNIAFGGCEEIQTSPRWKSPIKHMRPYQMEINRKASKMAEHQVTLGDDKLILLNGSKMESGMALPGIRGVKVSGMEPKILPGRDGSQFLSGMQQDIAELYDVMGMSEQTLEKKDGVVDPYTLVFKSAEKRKLFQENIANFQAFLTDITEIFGKLAPHYYDDEKLAAIVGPDDAGNLDELRNPEELCYQVEMEESSEDIDSQMGQQLILSQALQYSSAQLSREDIGKIISRMPFANAKDVLSDFTMDADLADNVVLALDRGKPPMVHDYDNHPYMIKRLTNRVRQPDFETLPRAVQMNYRMAIQLHEQGQAITIAKQMQLKNEFIPTDGAMVVCELYVKDPKNPLNSKRVRLPYASLDWLIKALEFQGHGLDQLEQMNAQAGNEVAGKALEISRQSPAGAPSLGPAHDSQPDAPHVGGNLPEMPGQA